MKISINIYLNYEYVLDPSNAKLLLKSIESIMIRKLYRPIKWPIPKSVYYLHVCNNLILFYQYYTYIYNYGSTLLVRIDCMMLRFWECILLASLSGVLFHWIWGKYYMVIPCIIHIVTWKMLSSSCSVSLNRKCIWCM